MIDLKKAMTRISELEEELKSTRDGYEEEMTILVEMNDDLTRKLGVFMEEKTTILLARRTTSSSTKPTQTPTIAMMTMLMKQERILWSLPPINISSRPPYSPSTITIGLDRLYSLA